MNGAETIDILPAVSDFINLFFHFDIFLFVDFLRGAASRSLRGREPCTPFQPWAAVLLFVVPATAAAVV